MRDERGFAPAVVAMPEWAFVLLVGTGGVGLGPILERLVLRLPDQEPRLNSEGIRVRALLLRLVTPVICGFLAWRLGPTPQTLAALFYAALFLLITAIDLEHRLVLNRVVLPAIAFAPVTATLWGLSPLSIALGGGLEFGFFLLSALLFRGAVGGGDVKLGAFLGLITGYPRVMLGLLVCVLVAGLVSGLLVVLRIKSRTDYIPYAPFMVLGAAVALVWSQ